MRSSSNGGEVLVMLFCYMIILIPIIVIMLISRWKIFVKAGQEGWMSIIPIYNTYILTTKIAGKDDMTFILHLLPIINIYALVVTNIALAKSFGKDDGYGIGLSFLAIIFYPMLAFSKTAVYLGPGGVNQTKDSSNSLTNNWQNNDPNNPPTV
jgi:hypothetical protein